MNAGEHQPADGEPYELSRGSLHLQPDLTVAVALPPHPASAAVARRRVEGVLRQWGCQAAAEAVLLVTNELVTNAIVHAQSELELTLQLKPDVLRVEVRDLSPDRPRLLWPSEHADRGRGMQLVSSVAEDWSSYRTGDGGKVVWCEVARPDNALRWLEPDAADGGWAARRFWLLGWGALAAGQVAVLAVAFSSSWVMGVVVVLGFATVMTTLLALAASPHAKRRR